MNARVLGLVLIAVVGCARAEPPDVALVARYETLLAGTQTMFAIELVWPLERERRAAPLLEGEP